jgi:hypothetical protein
MPSIQYVSCHDDESHASAELLDTRAVAAGPLFHRDNIIFGPALVRAAELEKVARSPRILIDNSVPIEDTGEDLPCTLQDHDGALVADPLHPIVGMG